MRGREFFIHRLLVTSFASTKKVADDAARRKGWSAARSLHAKALTETGANSSEPLTCAKIHSNLSWASLELSDFDEATQHARDSAHLAPSWGKAHARLGAALEASGRLLEADAAYRMAMTMGFTDCYYAHEKLKQNPRFRKLALIQEASSKEFTIENRVGDHIKLPPPNSDLAVLAMSEEQRVILHMIEHEGRVLPESLTSEDKLKQQDMILYLAAVDASIVLKHALVGLFSGKPRDKWDYRPRGHPLLCPGTRQWILQSSIRDFKNKPQNDERKLNEGSNFDVYHVLFHMDESVNMYEKSWVDLDLESQCGAYTIKFCPIGDCDFVGLQCGPTVTVEGREFFKDLQSGKWEQRYEPFKGTFLMGLRHWIMVRCRTDVIPLQGAGLRTNGDPYAGSFEWDTSKQKLVTNIPLEKFANFNETAGIVVAHFSRFFGPPPESVPYELYWAEDF